MSATIEAPELLVFDDLAKTAARALRGTPAAPNVVETAENLSESVLTALDVTEAFIRRYVSLGEHEAAACTLWAAHTHCFEAAESTPYLWISSTGPGSGKTRLLEVLELVAHNPWLTGRVTGPALVRKVGAEHPTLLLDETDALFTGGQASQQMLRGVINSGYRLGGKVAYARGNSYEELDVYCPKAFAGLGDSLPRTVRDRSVPIMLRKRTGLDTVERLRQRDVKHEARVPRQMLARFGVQRLAELACARPMIPTVLDDRAADVWEPLFAIAEAVGGDWPARARAAAIELCSARNGSTDTIAFQLLADCKRVFAGLDVDRLQSAKLVEALLDMDGSAWPDLDGRPIDVRILADMLRAFGVGPGKLRFGRVTAQGYERRAFAGAWQLLEEYELDTDTAGEEVTEDA